VSIHGKRTIKVCAFLDRAFAAVFHPAAPEDGPATIVSGLQLQPGVIRINCTAGEKVADFLGADHYVTRTVSPARTPGCTRFSGAVTGNATSVAPLGKFDSASSPTANVVTRSLLTCPDELLVRPAGDSAKYLH